MNEEKKIAQAILDAQKMRKESYFVSAGSDFGEYRPDIAECLIKTCKEQGPTQNMWCLLDLAMHWWNNIQLWAETTLMGEEISDDIQSDSAKEYAEKVKSSMNETKPKRIGIIGSRRRDADTDYAKLVSQFADVYKESDTIVSGGYPKGGDRFAEVLAKVCDIPITLYKPNWKLGRHAGFLRNTTIAENCDVLIACVTPDRRGGTEDTIKKFMKFNPDGKVYLVR